MGSTRLARIAGTHTATSATLINISGIYRPVKGVLRWSSAAPAEAGEQRAYS